MHNYPPSLGLLLCLMRPFKNRDEEKNHQLIHKATVLFEKYCCSKIKV